MRLRKLGINVFFYLQLLIIAIVVNKIISLSLYLLKFKEPFDYFGYAFHRLLHLAGTEVPYLSYSDYVNLVRWLIHGEKYLEYLYLGIISPTPFSILTLFILYSMCLVILILATKRFHQSYTKPMEVILKGIDHSPEDGEISKLVNELSKRLEVNPPKVFVANSERVTALSAKMNPKEDFLLLSNRLIKQLSLDELKAVIAHELCHIKTDVEEVTRSAIGFSRYLAEYPLLLSSSLLALLASYFFFDVFSKEAYFPYFFVDLMFLCALYLTLYLAALFLNLNVLFGSLYPNLRELDADLISSLITRKPKALIAALKTLILMKMVNVRFPSLQFFKPFKKEAKIKKWKDIFQSEPWIAPPWVAYIHPSPLRRIRFLKLLDKLMNDKVSLKINKPLRKFSALEIFWPNFLLLWSPWGRRLRKMEGEEIKAVYDYMRLNSGNFNLSGCARGLGMEELNVASIFVSFLMRGMVDVVSLSP
ncbi:MAG: M48 family metallopeptidase [Nitrososphaerales archaeon]